MAKIKLTKTELKKQKDELKRFKRYLPTLQLKKQQLQIEIRQVEAKKEIRKQDQDAIQAEIDTWIQVFGEEVGIAGYVRIKDITIEEGNIAGVDIPVFENIEFEEIAYDLYAMPLWVDKAIKRLQEIMALNVEMEILDKQIECLGDELRTTTQRVNLFEKVKIPEAIDNIRNINIYLGDQQTAAVVRGKIAKTSLTKV